MVGCQDKGALKHNVGHATGLESYRSLQRIRETGDVNDVRAVTIADAAFRERGGPPPNNVELRFYARRMDEGWEVRIARFLREGEYERVLPTITVIVIGSDWKVRAWLPGA